MADKVGNDSESNSSSLEEADNTEDDEDYIPDASDFGGDPDGVEVKKLKLKVDICLTCTIGFVRTTSMLACRISTTYFSNTFYNICSFIDIEIAAHKLSYTVHTTRLFSSQAGKGQSGKGD